MRGAEHLDSGGAGLRVGLCSLGLMRLPHLPAFLGLEKARFSYALTTNAKSFDLFIGWGRKSSGVRALRLAEAQAKPYLLLEDGFLRSVHPNSVSPSAPLSLAVDDRGIFYDASTPSRLEDLIAHAAAQPSSPNGPDGAEIIQALRAHRLSKYNFFPDPLPDHITSQPAQERVLVVDQTAGDLSIAGAEATGADFDRMLEAARDENPGAEILIKSHPETLAGKRAGYLSSGNTPDGCHLVTQRCDPWRLLDHVGRVYVVSSQFGMDALMAGRKVSCFGLPFYAGWGLTEDAKPCARRHGKGVSLGQMAEAVYGHYCRYVDPYSGSRTTFSKSVDTLAHLRDVAQAGHALGPFLHIYPWARASVRAMFQLRGGAADFFLRPAKAIDHARRRKLPITSWAARTKAELADRCAAAEVPLYRIEDGFVRSVGLGANFHKPMSLVLDKTGIHYDGSKTSDLETLLATHAFDARLMERARALIATLTQEHVTKYNLASTQQMDGLPPDRETILVPGQVENDASVIHSGSALKTSKELLAAVRRDNPDAFIVFKPHPDVASGQRPGLWKREEAEGLADLFLDDASIVDAIEACHQIHVISSLAGFEGLLRGKAVTCHGLPFYAGWGLTTDRVSCARRQRKLSLEQLVAASLILYPNYLDPVTQLPCGPETVIARILEQRAAPKTRSTLVRSREFLGYFRRVLRLVQR